MTMFDTLLPKEIDISDLYDLLLCRLIYEYILE